MFLMLYMVTAPICLLQCALCARGLRAAMKEKWVLAARVFTVHLVAAAAFVVAPYFLGALALLFDWLVS
ncbi:MAG: hypothetical protein U1D55_08955 [Phycisphaerae bacterium]